MERSLLFRDFSILIHLHNIDLSKNITVEIHVLTIIPLISPELCQYFSRVRSLKGKLDQKSLDDPGTVKKPFISGLLPISDANSYSFPI